MHVSTPINTHQGESTMNNNRNQRINQVTNSTLILGIDIAKRTHYACAVDDRGRELSKSFSVQQSNQGFQQFYIHLHQLLKKHQKKDLLIGFEPTGHYWMNLAAFLASKGIRYVIVNPLHVKRSKELDDNLQTKNDKKDARVIAKLITNGYFSHIRKLEGIEAELRQGSSIRGSVKKEIAKVKNQIIRWTDRYFPEFHTAFKELGKNACAVLKQTPLPVDLVGREVEELITFYRDKEHLAYPARPKIAKLIKAAEQSIGLKEGVEMARMEIVMLIQKYELYTNQLEIVNQELKEMVENLAEFHYLLSVPGIGEETVIDLLSEVGSLQNYQHPRQLIKLAGLTLRDNSSGEYIGRKSLSKRGRRKLRSLLYRAVLPLIRNNKVFHDLYQYYITRTNNPLKKKEALVILCSKLLKVFHGLSHHKVLFDGERMRQDLSVLQPKLIQGRA